MGKPPRSYQAFISYSHSDEKVARWLHRKLEGYKIPKSLVGQTTPVGVVPRRVFPVFLDREEIPTSSDLGETIRTALANSRCLIVICSPKAARSRWVNEECLGFKRIHGEARIIGLIVAGEPNAADKDISAELECFPSGLRFRMGSDGLPTNQRVEPIAADIRSGHDTRRVAFQRLLAGALGVDFDALRQRDKIRRQRRLAKLGILSAAMLAVVVVLSVIAISNARKVDEQKGDVAAAKTMAHAADEDRQRALRMKFLQSYLSDMRQIPQQWENNDIAAIRDRLDSYIPKGSEQEDPRGFEWYYWNHKVQGIGQRWQAGGRVTSLDWALDGNTLYVSDLTGQLTAWDRASGGTTPVRGPESKTARVFVAPGGDTIAALSWPHAPNGGAGGIDVAIDILKNGNVIRTFHGDGLEMFQSAAFSPNGKRLYAGTALGRIPSFNLENGKALIDLVENPKNRQHPFMGWALLNVHEGQILSLAVSPDGETVASGGMDGQIGLWSEDGRHYAAGFFLGWLDGHHGHVVSLAFSADGSNLVSRSVPTTAGLFVASPLREDNSGTSEVIVWSLASKSILRRFPLLGPTPSLIADTRDGAGVAGGNYRAEFMHSDTQVVAGDGKVVNIWDYLTGELKSELKGHAFPIVSLRACPKTGLLATADERGEVRIWDLNRTSEEEMVLRLDAPARGMSLPLSGGRLAILQDDGVGTRSSVDGDSEIRPDYRKINFYTPPDCKPVLPEIATKRSCYVMACSPSGRYAAAFGSFPINDNRDSERRVDVWETATGKLVRSIKWSPGALTPQGRVASAPKPGFRTPGDAQCLAFRNDDELYVCGMSVLVRANVQTGACEEVNSASVGSSPTVEGFEPNRFLNVPPDAVMALAFSPDGTKAVLGNAAGDATVYDANTWKSVALLRGHTRGITSLAFTADGKRLASSSGRYSYWFSLERGDHPGEVIVWDTTTWQRCLTLSCAQKREFQGVGFAEDGRTLYALTNRIEPDSVLQPRGELIRWNTQTDPAKTVATPSVPATSEKLLARSVLHSLAGRARNGMTGYTRVAIHPSGHIVAALTCDGQLVLWNPNTGDVMREIHTQEPVFGGRMTFSSDGQRLLCFTSQAASMYSVPDLELMHQRKMERNTDLVDACGGNDNGLTSLECFYPDPQNVPAPAISRRKSDDKGPKSPEPSRPKPEYRLLSGSESKRLDLATLLGAAFSPDARHLLMIGNSNVSGKPDGSTRPEIRLVSVPDGKILFTAEFADRAAQLGFSGDGKMCYVVTVADGDTSKPATATARLQRWAVPTGEKQLDVTVLQGCSFAPDLQFSLAQPDSVNIYSVNLATGQQSPQAVAVEAGARGLVFFPDGRHFLTFGQEAAIHIWDLRLPVAKPGNVLP